MKTSPSQPFFTVFLVFTYGLSSRQLRDQQYLYFFLTLRHGNLSKCEGSDRTVMGRYAASYPPLPASPAWNTPSPGCFLPHIYTVLRLPFAHYESLNSQIQELQCECFPARDRDVSFKQSSPRNTCHFYQVIIHIII